MQNAFPADVAGLFIAGEVMLIERHLQRHGLLDVAQGQASPRLIQGFHSRLDKDAGAEFGRRFRLRGHTGNPSGSDHAFQQGDFVGGQVEQGGRGHPAGRGEGTRSRRRQRLKTRVSRATRPRQQQTGAGALGRRSG